MQKNIKRYLGFSLLELLIYMAILSGLIIISSNMFISLSKGQGQTQAKSEVDSSVRFASELLRQDIKNASSISTPTIGTPSSSMTLVRNGVTIIYDVSGGVLRRKEGISSPENITGSNITVSSPSFTRIENTNLVFSSNNKNTVISISMVFGYNSSSPDWSYSTMLRTAVGLYSNS